MISLSTIPSLMFLRTPDPHQTTLIASSDLGQLILWIDLPVHSAQNQLHPRFIDPILNATTTNTRLVCLSWIWEDISSQWGHYDNLNISRALDCRQGHISISPSSSNTPSIHPISPNMLTQLISHWDSVIFKLAIFAFLEVVQWIQRDNWLGMSIVHSTCGQSISWPPKCAWKTQTSFKCQHDCSLDFQ